MSFSDWSDADKQAFGDFIQNQVRATLIPAVPQPDGTKADEHLGSVLRGLTADVGALKKKAGV